MISCVKSLDGLSEETHLYRTPSLALKIGYSLKRCARIHRSMYPYVNSTLKMFSTLNTFGRNEEYTTVPWYGLSLQASLNSSSINSGINSTHKRRKDKYMEVGLAFKLWKKKRNLNYVYLYKLLQNCLKEEIFLNWFGHWCLWRR